jgi:methionine sulfoxide reductase heme-binding subunit
MDADYRARRYAKPIVFLLCLWPAAWLAAGILALQSGDVSSAPARALGVNPVETAQDTLGIWGLRLLLVTLAITPLRVIGGWPWLQAYRRMLGLFAFFYVAMHLLWYLFVDQAFDWRQLAADVVKRPYVTAGFTAFLLLVPLAATSTRGAMRRLGRRWAKLHRLVYAAAALACVHFWWQVKADIREPLVYASILALLLGWRVYRRRAAAALPSAAASRSAERREGDGGQDQAAARGRAPVERLAEDPPGQR